MSRSIFFHGLQRSGNHAVIDWILRGRPGTIHLNNAFRVSLDLKRPGVHKFPRHYQAVLLRALAPKDAVAALLGARILVSFEDYPVEQRYFRNPPPALHAVVVRSARNVFASRIRQAFTTSRIAYPRVLDGRMRRAMAVWIDHARAFRERAGEAGFVGIAFDRWLTDPVYRAGLAARFGFEDPGGPSAERSRYGGGSSFDGLAPVGAADIAGLTRRDAVLGPEERALLDAVMADPELAAEAARFDAASARPVARPLAPRTAASAA